MKATELRIGNWINSDKFDACRVTEISEKYSLLEIINPFGYKEGDVAHSYDELKPILLTENWFLKFGFEKWKHPDYDSLFMWRISVGEDEFFINGKTVRIGYKSKIILRPCQEMEYVHQLQNLYFALTGNELSVGTK